MAASVFGMRSRALDAVFLVSVAFGVAIYVVVHRPPIGERLLPPPLFALAIAAIVVGWFWLSWEREPRLRPRLLSALWAILVFAGTLDAFGAGAMCALATANLVFVWGLAPAATYVVVMAVGNIVYTLGHRPLNPVDLGLFLYVLMLYTAVCVTSEVVRRARGDKRRTESLLTQLENAHAELSDRADRIRDLTVAAERARFARDMHDSLGHHLTLVILTLRNALRTPPDRRPEARREVEQALELAKQALEETRRTVRALHPLHLSRDPLDAVLDSLLQGFRSSDRRVELHVEGSCDAIDSEVAEVVYRTAQEAMTNIARHSEARAVQVALTAGDLVELSVRDDGPPRPGPTGTGGSGLRGLTDRASQLGGTLDAEPSRAGFTLRLRVPARPASSPKPTGNLP